MQVYYEKILSTPFKIVGSLIEDSYSLKLIFYNNSVIDTSEINDNRFARTYMALCVTIENDSDCVNTHDNLLRHHKKSIVSAKFENYQMNIMNLIRNFLALHFGKVFFDHGVTRIDEQICLPSLDNYSPIKYSNHMCCNKNQREDFNFGNNLFNCGERINKLLNLIQVKSKRTESFLKSLDLYYDALTFYNTNETTSFMLFVSAIETLLDDFLCFSREQVVLDNPNVNDIFCIIDKYINCLENKKDNKKVKGFIINEMYAIKTRFTKLLLQYLKEDFYENGENDEKIVLNIKPDEMEKVLKNIYDIRSDYLHNGKDIIFEVSHYYSFNSCGRIPIMVIMEKVTRYVLNCIFEELVSPK